MSVYQALMIGVVVGVVWTAMLLLPSVLDESGYRDKYYECHHRMLKLIEEVARLRADHDGEDEEAREGARVTEGRMTITYDEFRDADERMRREVKRLLDEQYGEIAGHSAGEIVDIWLEVGRRDDRVGIRMDNNFGVVSGEEAVRFADALQYAARIAAQSDILGCEVARA